MKMSQIRRKLYRKLDRERPFLYKGVRKLCKFRKLFPFPLSEFSFSKRKVMSYILRHTSNLILGKTNNLPNFRNLRGLFIKAPSNFRSKLRLIYDDGCMGVNLNE